MSSCTPATRGVVFDAQFSSASFANDSMAAPLRAAMAARGYDVVTFRVWPYVKSRPHLLALFILGAIWRYGFRCLRSKRLLASHITAASTTFDLATRLVRARIAATPNVVGVLQGGSHFDATGSGLPTVVSCDDVILNREHDLFEEVSIDPETLARERRLYAATVGMAVRAQSIVTALEENYGYPRERTRVVLWGINARPYDGPPIEDRYRAGRIVFIGRDWERKGGPELLAVFERLAPRFPHARLVVIGATPNIAHPQIDVLGSIPLDDIGRQLAGASIFCMPSRLEPAAVAPLEAAAAACPVVVTAVGGLPHTVVDGETGYLLPPLNEPALEVALTRLLDNPALCEAMGQAGRTHFASRFSWDQTCEAIAGLVDEAVRGRWTAAGAERATAPSKGATGVRAVGGWQPATR